MAIEDLFFQAIMADTILTEATAAIAYPLGHIITLAPLPKIVRDSRAWGPPQNANEEISSGG